MYVLVLDGNLSSPTTEIKTTAPQTEAVAGIKLLIIINALTIPKRVCNLS